MVYTEWLRIRNLLRGFAYVFLAFFIIMVILRIAVNGQMDVSHWQAEAAKSGAHTTVQTLPDGTKRTIIDNPSDRHMHIVIDDRGWFGKRVSVTTDNDRAGDYSSRDHDNVMGIFSMTQIDAAGKSTTVVDTESRGLDIGYMFAFSVLSGLIMATMLGGPLSRENSDHLEVVFTRPVSRLRLATNIVLADFAGIVGAFVLTVVFGLATAALYQLPALSVSADGAWLGLAAVLVSFAWYAMYLAATSLLKRGRGAVLGLSWLAGLVIIPPLAQFPLGSAIGTFVHVTFQALAAIDPLSYFPLSVHDFGQGPASADVGLFGLSTSANVEILILLTIVYVAAGLIEWQRVEA